MPRNLLFLLFLSFLGGCVGYYAYKQSILPTTSSSPLVVGIATGYAPFISTNGQGRYEGFDIDVIKAIASALNKKVIFKDLGSMTSLLIALDQGTVDAVIWGLSITEDRLKKMEMIRYQGQDVTSYPLLFWKTIPQGITSLSDMNGMTVCAEPGSSQSAVLDEYPSLSILPIERIDDALFNIRYGKATAAFVEPVIAQKFKKAYPEVQILDIPLAPKDQVQGVGIAVKKHNLVIKEDLERAITLLKNNGSLATYEQKWGLS